MKYFEASALIKATPEAIWAELTDPVALTSWPSGIVRIEGQLIPGHSFRLWSDLSRERPFRLKVSEFVPESRMSWVGGMPFGLFTGCRSFVLRSGDHGVMLTVREEFRGPILPLVWAHLPDLSPSFTQFVTGLKMRLETAAHD